MTDECVLASVAATKETTEERDQSLRFTCIQWAREDAIRQGISETLIEARTAFYLRLVKDGPQPAARAAEQAA